MSKKQNELKNALQTLKVNEALRLSKGQAAKDFAFRPPERSEIEPIPDQNNLSSQPAEMNPSSDDSKMSLPTSQIEEDSDQKHLSPAVSQPKVISARNELGSTESQLSETSVQINLSTKQSEIKASRGRNDLGSKRTEIASGFDVAPFVMGEKPIEFVEHGEGVFQIPHKIYEFVHKAVDTKVELLVFDCLLRYTLGFQRATCQASQSFIARWTGIAAPNVRKALRSLMEQGFILRLEEGTISHDSSVYEIPIVTAYLAYDRSRKLGAAFEKSSEIKSRSDVNNLGSDKSAISDRINLRTEIESISKKEKENINGNKTLSRELPASLKNYFSDKLPNQKREREWNAFKDLESQFTVEQIERAMDFVKKHGALENKAPVHSPMAYLSLSIRDILKCLNAENEASENRRKIEQRQLLERQETLRREEEEAAAFCKKEKAFCNAFPTTARQDELIREICKRQQFSWNPQGHVARSIAIQAWWDELSQNDRQAMERV